jgi:hypothetical protein
MKKTNGEIKRLKQALGANEKLMRDAAIKYEDLVAAKEELTAAIAAQKELRAKSRPSK